MAKKKGPSGKKQNQEVSNSSMTSNPEEHQDTHEDNDDNQVHQQQQDETAETITKTENNDNNNNNDDDDEEKVIQSEEEQQQLDATTDRIDQQHRLMEQEQAVYQEQQSSAVPNTSSPIMTAPAPSMATNEDEEDQPGETNEIASTSHSTNFATNNTEDSNDGNNNDAGAEQREPAHQDNNNNNETQTQNNHHQDPSPKIEQQSTEPTAAATTVTADDEEESIVVASAGFSANTVFVANESKKFGQVIGYGRGTPAFSNNNGNDEATIASSPIPLEATTDHGLPTGRQWDSVEYARRWLLMAKDALIPQVTKPADVWFPTAHTPSNNNNNNSQNNKSAASSPSSVTFKLLSSPISAAANIAKFQNHVAVEAPQVGDVLVWESNIEQYPLGHVAVVLETSNANGEETIFIGEQGHFSKNNNVSSPIDKWEHETYSRKLKSIRDPVSNTVSVFENGRNPDTTTIIGWVRVLVPFLNGQLLIDVADRYRQIVTTGTVTRTSFKPDPTLPWLERGVPWDNFQMQSFACGGDLLKNPPSKDYLPSGYYTIDYDFWQRCRKLAETVHRLLYDTSRRIILDSENSEKGTLLLERQFGIPRALHSLLRASLATPAVSGRFDIGFDGAHGGAGGALKVFEYNCDSSAALLETVESQDKIAKYYKFDHVGQSGGMAMKSRLDWWWREFARVQYPRLVHPQNHQNQANRIIHFMVDDDPEERYTALCMMESAKAAKFKVQMCVKVMDFRKMENGDIVDLGGNVVQVVWKTWSWDTALNQFNNNAATSTTSASTSSSTRVQLTDILFNANIVVFEPFWKAVCGNKALLPFAYQAEPHNEFLLKSFFDKDAAISKAYVRKPVSGRAGSNITVHDDAGSSSASAQDHDLTTGGKWEHGQFIYQEKVNVSVLNGKFPTFCAWVVGNHFGGMVVRENKMLVTQLESPVAPVRVKRY